MKKKIGYFLLTILVIIVIGGFLGIRKFNEFVTKETPNYLTYSYEPKPISFEWATSNFETYQEKQTAMIIPLKIGSLTHNFYMQFDTGSPFSFIYENDLKSLQSLGIKIKEVLKDEERYIEKLNFNLNGNHISASMVKIYVGYGNTFEKNDTIQNIKIGTIGSDFIDNRATKIDFKNQTINIFNERPEFMSSLGNFKSFDYTGRRRVMLPVKIDNKDYEFLYDSGCSAFGLITIKNRYDTYTDEKVEELSCGANSWGNSIPIVTKPSSKQFSIGGANLELKRVSYVNMYTFTQPLVTPFTRIGGWLGNQPFNESVLILDTINEEFAIINE